MKNLNTFLSPLIFACLTFSFSAPSLAQSNEEAAAKAIKPLLEQNQRVLSGRVHKILEARFSSMNGCPVDFQQNMKAEFNKLPAYSDKREIVVQTLNLYLRSYMTTDIPCLTALQKSEQTFHTSERRKFGPIHSILNRFCSEKDADDKVTPNRSCLFKIHQFFADLDPHCVSTQVPNPSGTYDPFPCMAADYLVGKSLVTEKTWTSFLPRTQGFLENFREALANPKAKSEGIDLWSLYLGDNPDRAELREAFLAEIDFYFSSFHSSSSYIRGFHDHIWSFVLFKTQSAEQALDYFNSSRLIVDQFRTLNNWASKHHIPLNIHGIKLERKNRHNYMAAYLACHYRKENRVFHESLPILLGYAYEGLDFKSHFIDEKDSWKVSKENFKTDTDRYRTGAYWGYRFCQMEF